MRSNKRRLLLCFLSFIFNYSPAQIANYVQNGGFEECGVCLPFPVLESAKYWTSFDTSSYNYIRVSELPPSYQVPNSGFAWQWPKSGASYIISSLYSRQPNDSQSSRIYPRNFLKGNLQAGKTYCVKFYYSIANVSTYGVDGLGAYFGDQSMDTITQGNKQVTYLTPQVQNPTGNILKDTLNWNLITGTFTANGTEKNLVLGNFKSDLATDTLMINPMELPIIQTSVLFDNVSCIDIDLPAYAGGDHYLITGDSAFLGRQPDVGINEACTWYKTPNLSVPIATIAGLYVKPAITTTYVVRQEICGLVKWDTVIVFASALSVQSKELGLRNLKLYPIPATDELHLEWSSEVLQKQFTRAEIVTSLGQTFPQELPYDKGLSTLQITHLPAGVYTLRLMGDKVPSIEKRFVINR